MAIHLLGWSELANRIRSGDIGVDLARPVDLQFILFATDLGRSFYYLVFMWAPLTLVGIVIFGVEIPADPWTLLSFTLSVILAVAVSYAFRFLYNTAAYWLLDLSGVILIASILSNVLSGFVLPVSFFPDWLRALAVFSPFPAMVQIPTDILLGVRQESTVVSGLLTQAVWIVALGIAGRASFKLGVRRVVIQGG